MSSDEPQTSSGPTAAAPMNELLVRAAAGDQQAFAAMYDEVAPRVYGLVLRVLVDRAQADEVTQEVFLETWRKARTFDPQRGSALSWVLTIAHRRAVDRVRAASAAHERDLGFEARTSTTAFDSTAEHVLARLDADAVQSALATLTQRQREAVELAYFCGRTHVQVAQVLGIPLGTAKARIRDGLRRLRDEIGGGR